jgi:hypothetical protein
MKENRLLNLTLVSLERVLKSNFLRIFNIKVVRRRTNVTNSNVFGVKLTELPMVNL